MPCRRHGDTFVKSCISCQADFYPIRNNSMFHPSSDPGNHINLSHRVPSYAEPDATAAEQAVKALLLALGEDTNREGLLETPRRMASMLIDLCTKQPFKFTTFTSEGMDQMIVQTNIPFHSLCEHHVLPFMGTAAVAYIPNGKIVGLSKLTRAVHYCARGLQNQERITRAVADMLETNLSPLGIGVVLKARHLCMELRGASAPNVWTTTSDLRGELRNDLKAREEFLSLVK